MAKVTPCQMGYNCPYCRQIDASHTISLFPQCPIVWIDENDVYDTLTGERMPFVKRPVPKQCNDDDNRFDYIPIFHVSNGGVKKQKKLYRV